MTVPNVVPDREELALLKMVVVKIEAPNGKGGLIVAIYGTAESKRLDEANFVELYNLAGNHRGDRLVRRKWAGEGCS